MSDRRDPRDSRLPTESATLTDFRSLHHKLERALSEIARADDVEQTLERILETLQSGFSAELGFTGGRIYRREDDGYSLCCGFGSSRGAKIGLRVPPDYPPHLKTLEEGLLIMRKGDPGLDQAFEHSIGVDSSFAAIVVGKEKKYIIAFSIDGEVQEERVLYSLTAVRHVINLKLDQVEFTGQLEESRAVQESMLPSASPGFPGFDIDGRSRPAKRVGGDLFDFLSISEDVLGLAIVDASGHGLPSALIARDVITGLRTLAGDERDVADTVRRLNQVIHRAALSRMFVSLFYVRLGRNGELVYCNAGHNAPLLHRGGACRELKPGGPVLGPIPHASYRIGTECLAQGERLVLFTDGVVERENGAGESFGTGRLCQLMESMGEAGAAAISKAIFAAVDLHAAGAPQHDDMTAVVVVRS